jgi:hypothetical protein
LIDAIQKSEFMKTLLITLIMCLSCIDPLIDYSIIEKNGFTYLNICGTMSDGSMSAYQHVCISIREDSLTFEESKILQSLIRKHCVK